MLLMISVKNQQQMPLLKKRNILSCLAVLVLVALGIARLNVLLRPVDTDSPVTAIETFHTLPEIREAARELQGAKRWIFQPFVPHENLPQESLRTATRTKPSFLQECVEAAAPFVQQATHR